MLCRQVHVMRNIQQQQHNLNRTHFNFDTKFTDLEAQSSSDALDAHCICLSYYCELLPVGLTPLIAKLSLNSLSLSFNFRRYEIKIRIGN